MKIKTSLLLLMLLAAASAVAQKDVELLQQPFIRYDSNILRYDASSATMQRFFDKWHRVTSTGQGSINIVHIGGSHVQAGTLTNRIRTNILSQYPSLVGSRGMIFPYSAAAKCNNPSDYRVHCKEKVVLTRNVHKEPQYAMGLCGIAITASDSLATVQIALRDSVNYATSQVVVFGHSPQNVIPRLSYQDREVYPSYVDPLTHRYVFNLSTVVDSFDVLIPCDSAQTFTLTGIHLGSKHKGITYHSIGVNGAAVPDYLKCQHFTTDLSMLHPDMVVFGIGINDASGPNFDTAVFRQNYLQLIDSIRTVNPECAFVFITNNDSFKRIKKGQYAVNKNGALARDVFYRLADDTQGAVWDQFEIMGGLKSMDKWRLAKLAQNDRVHYTRAGYELVGDLFTNAFFAAVRKTAPTKTADAPNR